MSKVGLSTGFLQRKYGDREALRIAKEAGADAVDFSLDGVHSCDKESSVYSRAEEEIIAYFSDLKEFAKELERRKQEIDAKREQELQLIRLDEEKEYTANITKKNIKPNTTSTAKIMKKNTLVNLENTMFI